LLRCFSADRFCTVSVRSAGDAGVPSSAHDLNQASTFFNDILGFETKFRASNNAYIGRETVAFRSFEPTGPDGAPLAIGASLIPSMRDVDRLYAELKPKLDTLPKGDVYGAVKQTYG
jgi:hypothetical protein